MRTNKFERRQTTKLDSEIVIKTEQQEYNDFVDSRIELEVLEELGIDPEASIETVNEILAKDLDESHKKAIRGWFNLD